MSFNKDHRNQITNINNMYEIANGTPDELKQVDPNQVGEVVDIAGVYVSQITPIIMIINQNRKDVAQRLAILRENGGDFDKKIDYYGKQKSANDIMN